MAKKFPQDEFDALPELSGRAGRHLARRTGKDRALDFGKIALAATLIAAAGYIGLRFIDNASIFTDTLDDPSASASASADSKGNGAAVSVLDGTASADRASKVAQLLLDKKWNVVSASPLDLAGGDDIKITFIYIKDETYRAAAESLVADMGEFQIVVSDQFTDPITVVLGKDYALPSPSPTK